MLQLKPLPENAAPEDVRQIYSDIRKTFSIDFVPLLFQYMGNFERYLSYSWERISANATSQAFDHAREQVTTLLHAATAVIYHPSKRMELFIIRLNPYEKHLLSKTVWELVEVNTELLLISLSLRESIKNVLIPRHFLPDITSKETESIFYHLLERGTVSKEGKDLQEAEKMLVPLYGSQTPTTTLYPDFFEYVADEISELSDTEAYLKARVELEKFSLGLIKTFPQSFGSSFDEIVALAGRDPRFYELLYLLRDVFPTQFPRLVLTSFTMKRILEG